MDGPMLTYSYCGVFKFIRAPNVVVEYAFSMRRHVIMPY